MKKLIFCAILAFATIVVSAQSTQQMQQLQNMTPAQLEQLKKMYGESTEFPSELGGGKSKNGQSNQSTQRERQYNDQSKAYSQAQGSGSNMSSKTSGSDQYNKGQFNAIDGQQQNSQQKYLQRADRYDPRDPRYVADPRLLPKAPMYNQYGELVDPVYDSVMVSLDEFDLIIDEKKKKDYVFGRDIFFNENLTFAPSLSIATPPSYVVSAGDQLIIQLWGAAEATYEPLVSPEGNISIEGVGLINVGGLTIAEAERRIKAKFATTVSGLSSGNANIKITLGDIRSIKVNIVGEAQIPGTYTLPSLATLFNALYVAGGVSDIGSLRNVKLYRGGKEIATLDVYDYLLKGRTDVDRRLEDNDMIVIAPYENIVTITGKTKRPRRYEIKRNESVQTLLDFAGGFTGDAYRNNIAVSRRAGGRQYTMHTVEAPEFSEFLLMDRDSINIGEIVKTYANRVTIEGAVWRKGDFELTDSIATAGALVRAAEGLSPDAFGGRAQIIRTLDDGSLQLIPLNVARILGGTNPDVKLLKNDRLVITSLNDLREGQTVSIKGEVNQPMIFPYAEGMTLQDAILMSKGLKSSASLSRIDVARRVSNPDAKDTDSRRAEMFTFSISPDLSLDDAATYFELKPFDEVFIRRSPGYIAQQIIAINGEVNFPGEYSMVTSSDRLTDLVRASGGLTAQAYVRGASLQRQVTVFDMQRMKSLKKLMLSARKDMNDKDTTNLVDEELQVGDYYPVGIDLVEAMNHPDSPSNLALRNGDILIVPTIDNTVKISGAVYYATTTTYDPKLSLHQYIKRAGGYADRALRQPFIIYMNGTVADARGGKKVFEPGCEIVVPYRPYVAPMNATGWISLSTSIVSMAAMITSLLKN